MESLKNRLPSVIFSRGFREEISQGKTPVLPTIYNALSELISIMVVLFIIHNSFRQKAESLQYNGAIAIAGAIRRTSRENIYQELDLKSVYQRRWYKNLCFFFDIFKI